VPAAGGSKQFGLRSKLGRLLATAAASYHLPLLIGFSVADTGNFVWGGAMLLKASSLAPAAAHSAADLPVTITNGAAHPAGLNKAAAAGRPQPSAGDTPPFEADQIEA